MRFRSKVRHNHNGRTNLRQRSLDHRIGDRLDGHVSVSAPTPKIKATELVAGQVDLRNGAPNNCISDCGDALCGVSSFLHQPSGAISFIPDSTETVVRQINLHKTRMR